MHAGRVLLRLKVEFCVRLYIAARQHVCISDSAAALVFIAHSEHISSRTTVFLQRQRILADCTSSCLGALSLPTCRVGMLTQTASPEQNQMTTTTAPLYYPIKTPSWKSVTHGPFVRINNVSSLPLYNDSIKLLNASPRVFSKYSAQLLIRTRLWMIKSELGAFLSVKETQFNYRIGAAYLTEQR